MKIRAAILLPLALLLAGCGPQLTDSNLKAVKADMSMKEVESVLGPPVRIEQDKEIHTQEVQTLPITHYVYEQEGRKVDLTFIGDHLASNGVDGTFDPPDPAKAAPSPTP